MKKNSTRTNDTAANLGFEAQLWQAADALRGLNDNLPDPKADFILANPPFNVSDWRGELLRDDKRWKYGAPPAGNVSMSKSPGDYRRGLSLRVYQPRREGGTNRVQVLALLHARMPIGDIHAANL